MKISFLIESKDMARFLKYDPVPVFYTHGASHASSGGRLVKIKCGAAEVDFFDSYNVRKIKHSSYHSTGPR